MSFKNLAPYLACGITVLCYQLAHRELALPMLLLVQAVLAVSVVVVIAFGADWLVESACRIAHYLGVSHLVIGLTVVAFGTSAPELAASLLSALRGSGDIAVANVVGSNIFNMCLILGGVATIVRGGLVADEALVRRDGPVLLVASLLLYLFVGALPGTPVAGPEAGFAPVLLNLRLERSEGLLLLSLLVGYLWSLYRGLGAGSPAQQEIARETDGTFGEASWLDVPMLVLGLVAVIGGCQVLVGEAELVDGRVLGHGALWFARLWGVPDYLVGVTIIAAGTSAPELVVSFVAATRGAFGLSAGNLIGSDIFNILGVVGVTGMVSQPPVAPVVTLSSSAIPGLAVMWICVLVAIVFMRTGYRISRAEGLGLIAIGLVRWGADLVGAAP